MRGHSHCEHDLAYCDHCDVAYCKKCSREWGTSRHHYYPWWIGNAGYPGYPWYRQWQGGTTVSVGASNVSTAGSGQVSNHNHGG